MNQPATQYRKPPVSASEDLQICWNCFGFRIRPVHNVSGHAEHSLRCHDCEATGAPEDFRGVVPSAVIVNQKRRA
jgi:hypothetical protein